MALRKSRLVRRLRGLDQVVGELVQPGWSLAEAERWCGVHHLTPVERSEVIAYNRDRGVMYIQTVCDYCQHAVEMHPELLIEGKLLQ
ncbi:MAG: anti-sigma-F factor Fin family protein [Alicyclobacillus sp.]|nr:anti-sigma-F factor Fin family protein [Alicyclobacillus sp.]